MKIKSVVVSSLLALASVAALAENNAAAVTLSSDQDGLFTGDLSFTHTVAGAFVDTYTFTGVSAASLTNASLRTQASNAYNDITLTSVTLNGIAFDLSKKTFGGYVNGSEKALLDDTNFSTTLTLVITGFAGGDLAAGTAITASYAATINATPMAAVPEPETLALMLAGLGAVGFVARRRSV